MIIHIGMPKTGSTAIQDVLAANRDILAKQEVHYPETATRGSAHHPLAWSAARERRPRNDVPALSETLKALTRELERASGKAVFSSEALFHIPGREFRPIRDWSETLADSLLVVAYVRPPAAFHEGWYRQLVKTSAYDLTFDQHIERAPLVDTRSRLESFEKLVARSCFIVKPYLRRRFMNHDIIEDFCSAIELDTGSFVNRPMTDSNLSLDAELVEFKVQLHKREVPHTPRLAKALLDWTVSRNRPSRSLFSPETWNAFISMTESDHMAVVKHFGLPEELRDQRPEELHENALSAERFNDLLDEFRERFPVAAYQCFDQLSS